MRYASDRYRYGAGDTPDTADVEFAGRVEFVGAEPPFGSGYVTATQLLGLTVTDVRRGSGVSVGDYLDVDVAIVAGARHVVPGNMNPDVPALDPSMIQPGVTLVAWANASDGRWQVIDVSTDGPVPAANYAGRAANANRYSTGASAPDWRANAYGRKYSIGLEAPLDLTDFPTNVFVIVADTDTPAVPRQIRKSDHDALQRAWDRMMKGQGLIVDGPTVTVNGKSMNLASRFRELLRGGLADSPFIRALFQEIVNDDAHPVTVHVVHDAVGILVDGFQFNPNVDRRVTPTPHKGHHTIDMEDFDQFPRVSGNPRNNMMLTHQNLVHALREARQACCSPAPETRILPRISAPLPTRTCSGRNRDRAACSTSARRSWIRRRCRRRPGTDTSTGAGSSAATTARARSKSPKRGTPSRTAPADAISRRSTTFPTESRP